MKFLTKEDRYDVFTVPSKGGLKGIHKSVSLKRVLDLIKSHGEMRVVIYRVTFTKLFGITVRKRYYFKSIDPLYLLLRLATEGLIKNETP